MTKEATPRGADSVTPRGRDTKSAQTDKPLNAKQLRFVEEYLKDLNATQAVIRAGYSARNADVTGPRMLGHVGIATAIDAKRRELTHANGITVERVLKELSRLAFVDTRKLYKEDGSLKMPHEWDDDTAAAIAGLDTVEEFAGKGDARESIGWSKKVKQWEKKGALETLLKHLGASGDKPAENHLHVNITVPGLADFAAKLAKVVG